jgi:uncharacterized tellurite resistance protein B-like protein
MLERLKRLIDGLADGGIGEAAGEDERAAVAALLVHAATVDGKLDPSEERLLADLVRNHYGLELEDAAALVRTALENDPEVVEIYRFTRVIQSGLEPEARQAIIRLMWRIAVADGEIHEYEANLIWRTAELIGVSTRDRVRLRQEVLAAMAAGGDG